MNAKLVITIGRRRRRRVVDHVPAHAFLEAFRQLGHGTLGRDENDADYPTAPVMLSNDPCERAAAAGLA
jgi:hypothetical protein